MITVWKQTWKSELTDEQKTALVDHELSHCWAVADDYGHVKIKILPHDCEEFFEIARRYGAWSPDVQSLINAAKGQPRLEFSEEAA